MFLLISLSILFQTISLHYVGDKKIENLLFSGSNQFKMIEECNENCVSITVNKKKVTLILKSQGESIKKKYDFSKETLSPAQYADLLRLKIILFRKEYKKKVERRFIYLLKYEIESKIKLELEEKIKKELEEKIKLELEEKIKLELKENIELELEKKIKLFKNELENKIFTNLSNKQKESLNTELKEIKKELKIKLENELKNNLKKILKSNITAELENAKKELKKELKKEIKKEIKQEIENEHLKKQYNNITLAGNINTNIKRDKLSIGTLLEYRQIDAQKIIAYTFTYLFGREGSDSKDKTSFILFQISMGRSFQIYKNINLEFLLGGFSTIVNLTDKDDKWYFGWETAGGVLGSLNTSITLTPKWGVTFKTDLFLFLVNYRNTDNDGLYGNKKMSESYSLGVFFKF